MGNRKVIITRHIKDRIKERFPDIYENLENSSDEDIRTLIKDGIVDRSFINNTKFMQYLYDTYGFGHTYDFIINGNIVFVIKKKKGDRVAVTCLDKRKTSFVRKNTKFKGKKKNKKPKKVIGIHSLDELDGMDIDIDSLIGDIKK
jgi:hypothetical protein